MPSRTGSSTVLAGTYSTTYPGDIPEKKYCLSESYQDDLVAGAHGHWGFPNFPPARDCGGQFGLAYRRIKNGSVSIGDVQGTTAYQEHRYSGSVFANAGPLYGGSMPGTYNDWVHGVSNLGATAYNRMKPDKPLMDLPLAIYELKDIPQMLRQRFLVNNLHELGDAYLAQQFGWKALAKDVTSFVLTHINAQKALKQLLRDEGRPVIRKIQLSSGANDKNETTGFSNALSPSFVGYFYAPGSSYHSYTATEFRTWASAQFRYWLPGGPRDVNWTNSMKRAIFGLNVAPSTVYQAIPWTWLASWFTNVGDMIANLETTLVDRLAADYFYVMGNVAYVSKIEATSYYYRTGSLEIVPASASGIAEYGYKIRLPGDPFGFGTPQNSLNGVQLSILGALGLSRIGV